jgi:hypothetical protein
MSRYNSLKSKRFFCSRITQSLIFLILLSVSTVNLLIYVGKNVGAFKKKEKEGQPVVGSQIVSGWLAGERATHSSRIRVSPVFTLAFVSVRR